MKNLPKDKRDRLILIALVTVMTLVGTWYLLISSQKKVLAGVSKAMAEKQDKVSNAERLVNSIAEFKTKSETSTQQIRSVEQSMASGDLYSWIFLTVNKFRADYKVDIPQFSREVATDVGILPRFPYKAALFNVRGTAYFHDLGKFVADFENTFPYMRLQNLELEPAGTTSANSPSTSSSGSSNSDSDPEKLSFKMEIVALVSPHAN